MLNRLWGGFLGGIGVGGGGRGYDAVNRVVWCGKPYGMVWFTIILLVWLMMVIL